LYEAQHLRYKVYAEEMGAHIKASPPGIDSDMFDIHCEHLIVRDTVINKVIGTCRILSPFAARRMGGYYADEGFDLTRINHLRVQTVEIGRFCVHMNYRMSDAMAMLWSSIDRYMQTHGYQNLIGCVSVSMCDGGQNAASIYRRLETSNLCPIEYRTFPRCELPLDAYAITTFATKLPSLIKSYMNAGAYVCSTPAWDPDFNTADLLMMLPMARMNT
jgi:putative hemolysin